jgi:hypothetical protein
MMTTDIYREFAGKEYGKPIRNTWDGIYYDLKRDPTNPKEASARGKFRTEAQEIQLNTGVEYWCWNIGALRNGVLIDWIGERYEFTWGLGINLFDHFSIDWSTIYSPEGFMGPLLRRWVTDRDDSHREGSHGVRDRQFRFSVTYTRMAKRSPSDAQWFLRPRRP